MKKVNILFIIILVVTCFLSFIQCKIDPPEVIGGAGADFDANLYYTKTEVDTLITDASKSYCAIALQSTQSISDDTWTAISFIQEKFDNANMFALASPTEITCVSEGVYYISGRVTIPLVAGDIYAVKIVSDSAYDLDDVPLGSFAPAGVSPITVEVNLILPLSVGNTVELWFYQDSLGSANTSEAVLSVAKIGNQ